jgi:hypothetical protein
MTMSRLRLLAPRRRSLVVFRARRLGCVARRAHITSTTLYAALVLAAGVAACGVALTASPPTVRYTAERTALNFKKRDGYLK